MMEAPNLRDLDFSTWQDDECFGEQFKKLLEGLRVFYGEGR